MTLNFKLYSEYYDLLYQDKDYKAEAEYVSNHLRQLLPNAVNLLELGCGTANHARYLAELGYTITGVERSGEMIELARKKNIPGFNPVLSEMDHFQIENQFDAAISLFHSICYVTSNEQLTATFNTVSQHLRPGGVFAFDFWYAPAVLHHLPVPRIKCQQNESAEVIRSGETNMFIDQNIAEVCYKVTVRDKFTGKSLRFEEKHAMRYFTIPELALVASQAGFNLLRFEEFLTAQRPTLESRNVFVMFEKPLNG